MGTRVEWTQVLMSVGLAVVPMLASLYLYAIKQGRHEEAISQRLTYLVAEAVDLEARLTRTQDRSVTKDELRIELGYITKALADRERQLEKLADSNAKLLEKLGELRALRGRDATRDT